MQILAFGQWHVKETSDESDMSDRSDATADTRYLTTAEQVRYNAGGGATMSVRVASAAVGIPLAILIIFAVMLTRRIMDDVGPQVNRNWPFALLVSVGILVGLVVLLFKWPGFITNSRALFDGGENLVAFGQALVSPNGFVVPFEAASVLLVAALIGAIFVAGEPKGK